MSRGGAIFHQTHAGLGPYQDPRIGQEDSDPGTPTPPLHRLGTRSQGVEMASGRRGPGEPCRWERSVARRQGPGRLEATGFRPPGLTGPAQLGLPSHSVSTVPRPSRTPTHGDAGRHTALPHSLSHFHLNRTHPPASGPALPWSGRSLRPLCAQATPWNTRKWCSGQSPIWEPDISRGPLRRGQKDTRAETGGRQGPQGETTWSHETWLQILALPLSVYVT